MNCQTSGVADGVIGCGSRRGRQDAGIAFRSLPRADRVRRARPAAAGQEGFSLVAGSHGPDRELERLLARQNRSAGTKPILEINLRHPLVAAISGDGVDAADLSFLLLEQAQILDGELPEDPAAFAGRLNRLVLQGVAKGG